METRLLLFFYKRTVICNLSQVQVGNSEFWGVHVAVIAFCLLETLKPLDCAFASVFVFADSAVGSSHPTESSSGLWLCGRSHLEKLCMSVLGRNVHLAPLLGQQSDGRVGHRLDIEWRSTFSWDLFVPLNFFFYFNNITPRCCGKSQCEHDVGASCYESCPVLPTKGAPWWPWDRSERTHPFCII